MYNLKNISIKIPRDRLIVVIGLGQVEPGSLAAGAGTQGVSRDMTFDREIPTPGLIAPQHRYSMGMAGFMEMVLRGFIMPRPIPVPIRQAMFRLWQKGYGTRQIAESLGLPCSTVRRLLQRFRLHGTDGLSPDYWHPSVPEVAPPSWWRPP